MGPIRGQPNGVRSRMNGRPPSDAGGSENTASAYPISRAPSTIGTSVPRRFRGFQPDEVNKPKPKLAIQASSAVADTLDKPTAPVQYGTATSAGISAKTEAVVPSQPPESTPFAKGKASTKSPMAPESGAKHDRPPVQTTVTQEAKSGNNYEDDSPDFAGEAAVFDASKSRPGSDNIDNAEEPSPSDSSVQVIVDDEPQASYLSRALAPIKTSPPSHVPSPNGAWDNSTCDIDSPSWLRNDVSGPMNGIVNIDWRNLPPYKSPFKEDGPTAKKAQRDLASNSFGRQLANIKRNGQQTQQLPAVEASPPVPEIPKATAEAADQHVHDSLEKPSANPTTNNEPNRLAPHLRAQVASSVATTVKGGQTSERLAAKLAPHLKGSANKPQPMRQVEIPQELKDDKKPSKGVTDVDEELAASHHVVSTENDAEIAAAMAVGSEAGNEHIAPSSPNGPSENKELVLRSEKKSSKGEDPPKPTPPHLRRSKANIPDAKAKPGPHLPVVVHTATTENNGQDTTVTAYSGPMKDVTASQQNIKVNSTPDAPYVVEFNKSTAWKGKQPMKKLDWSNHPSGLVGWDGKMLPPRLDDEWDHRAQHDPKGEEKFAVIKTWTEDNAAEMQVGLTRNEEETMNLKDSEHPETIPHPDEFNQAKRHITTVHAIEAYEKKRSASGSCLLSPGDGLTKDEKRNNRRLLKEQLKNQVIITNEHAPTANIYLRPAEMADMRQVMQIHNYYVKYSACANEVEENDEIYWRSRFQESHNEHDPFLVAVLRSQMPTGETREVRRKRDKKSDSIVGFAFAADYGVAKTAYAYTVELEIWVHHAYHHQGIGRTMLDRMLAAMDPGYNLLECAPMRNCDTTVWMSGGRRIIKTILVNLLHCKANEASLEWKKKWLSDNNFEYQGTLKEIGFKEGQALHQCQMLYKTFSTLPFAASNRIMNGL